MPPSAFWLSGPRFGEFPKENSPSLQKVHPLVSIAVILLYALYNLFVRGFALPRTILAIAFVLREVMSVVP